MSALRFVKMHGLGNDFMVLELLTQHFKLDDNLIAQWGNHHTGVGFDQMLVLQPPQQPQNDFFCRIFNNDGSEAEQCGNGMRCIASFAWGMKLAPQRPLLVETLGGVVEIRQESPLIEVNMGTPIFTPEKIPLDTNFCTSGDSDPIWELSLDGSLYQMVVLSMGNPHAVLQVDDIAATDISTLGSALATHEAFTQGANIGFMQVVDRDHIHLRVFERGAGETLACGSGAAAAVVAGSITGVLDEEAEVEFTLGKLIVKWLGKQSPVWVSGKSTFVYEGKIRL